MESLLTDVRYGLRMLIKTPGLSAVAVLTIALGVGLTTHTFSIVYGSVIRGPDFDRGTTLVILSQDIPSSGIRGRGVPLLDLIGLREQQTAFRGLAALTMGTINLADDDSPPERFEGAFVSASVFAQVDGVPILGRVFNPEEDAGTGEQVVILGHSVWQGRYGGDPNILQRHHCRHPEAILDRHPPGRRSGSLHDRDHCRSQPGGRNASGRQGVGRGWSTTSSRTRAGARPASVWGASAQSSSSARSRCRARCSWRLA